MRQVLIRELLIESGDLNEEVLHSGGEDPLGVLSCRPWAHTINILNGLSNQF